MKRIVMVNEAVIKTKNDPCVKHLLKWLNKTNVVLLFVTIIRSLTNTYYTFTLHWRVSLVTSVF